jgi:hypothetical protein
VGHRSDREPPEPDHPVAVIEIDARLRSEQLGDMFGLKSGADGEPVSVDGLAIGEQAVDAERELLPFVAQRRCRRGELGGKGGRRDRAHFVDPFTQIVPESSSAMTYQN